MISIKGKIIFAGAGPGDPELITLKAYKQLQKADVVLADRLVGQEILENFISASAQLILVGKQCRKDASTPQETINQLMIYHALHGKTVVRLKGGDVSIFSNILSELEAIRCHDIPYEIIPGVTAALGAAALAGIPLTARGYATSVRWLTSYHSDLIPEEEWNNLASTDDTLVFYMSGETVHHVVKKLLQYNIDPLKLMALAEEVSTPSQRITTYNLYDFENEFDGEKPASPALIIIGKVVALHEKFQWMEKGICRKKSFSVVPAKLVPADPEDLKLLTA
ncbi:MAG: uroporphyrinogen-III C-methyltransferase [Flavisolibacter sp.]